MDHESYYMNITDANLTNQPKWLLEYTAKVGVRVVYKVVTMEMCFGDH